MGDNNNNEIKKNNKKDNIKDNINIKEVSFSKKIELIFEKCLWDTRLIVLLPVIFSLLGAVVLFIIGTIDIVTYTKYYFMYSVEHPVTSDDFIVAVIRAIDFYLVGVILLIFSFGLYELFISEIDFFEDSEASNTLKTHSLEQLKDRIGKTIIMVLIIYLFKVSMHVHYNSPIDVLILASSILALSIALYAAHKHNEEKKY